jgi:Domain of unknown function (DUF4328)
MNTPGIIEPYVSSRPRANLLTVFLALNIIVQLVAIVSTFMHIDLLYRFMSYGIVEALTPAARAEQQASEGRETMTRIMQLAAFTASAVMFLIWLRRAYQNLKPLGGEPRYSSAWTVGAFLVPVVNLFLPFQIFQEIWRASDPETIAVSGAKPVTAFIEDSSKSLLVVIWWGLWLLTVMNLVVAYRWRVNRQVLNDEIIVSWLILTLSLLLVVDSIVTAVLVKKITNRQDERNQRLAELAA